MEAQQYSAQLLLSTLCIYSILESIKNILEW